MECHGAFETHLTVAEAPLESLRAWASVRRVKFTHILLDAGVAPSQPMVTLETTGTLEDARAAAKELAGELAAVGFSVVRTKIEASPRNTGVPRTARDVELLSRQNHFEHHVKILMPGGLDLGALRECAEKYGGHLSLNARRKREAGGHERFVTQRCYGVPLCEARRRLAELLRSLRTWPVELLEVEQEYVVYDSNVDLDRGWMAEALK